MFRGLPLVGEMYTVNDNLIYKKSKATGIAIHDIQNNIFGEVFIMDPMDGKTCLMVV